MNSSAASLCLYYAILERSYPNDDKYSTYLSDKSFCFNWKYSFDNYSYKAIAKTIENLLRIVKALTNIAFIFIEGRSSKYRTDESINVT